MDWPNHENAWKEWRSAMSSARMHHGWIFAGRQGLGKEHFASAAARELVAEKGVPQPDKDHPDILHLTHLPKDEKEERKKEKGDPYEVKRNITVGQIRTMQQALTTRPTLGSRRVVLIDPADDMEKSASNALLKSLEEPPIGTFFILLTHRPARLLPTIRSRCRMVNFPGLSDVDLKEALLRSMPQASTEDIALAIEHSGGSPGNAMTFMEQELGKLAELFDQIAQRGDHDLVLRASVVKASGQRPSRERIAAIIALMQSTLARGLAEHSRAKQLAAIDAHHQLGVLAAQAPTYNYDTSLLLMEASGLLARAGQASD